MSDNKNISNPPEGGHSEESDSNIAASGSKVVSETESVRTSKSHRASSTSERQIKFEKAQRCLENAALVSKRIKEHRKATAELLGRPFEDDEACETASEITSNVSEKTGYSVATDTSTAMSVQDALNIPGISESLANTLKQKEILMERIKQYKEISKRPSIIKSSPISKRESTVEPRGDARKSTDGKDQQQLQNAIKEKDNLLSVMQVKMKAMETTILDLQEKIGEKDQIIEAKNKATTLMSGNISKKEKDALVLLDDTRQQMSKMQENFIAMESEWREEKQKLVKEIEKKDERISSLEEANNILETARFELSVSHAKIAEELETKNKLISELEDQLAKLSETPAETPEKEEKGTLEIANMEELSKRIELLEQLNCQMRQANKELENKLASATPGQKSVTSSPTKKPSPGPTRKGKNTRMKSPWSNMSSESLPQDVDKKQAKNEPSKVDPVIQSLNKDILDKEYLISQKDNLISELEKLVSEKDSIIRELESKTSAETRDIGIDAEVIEKEQFEEPERKKEVASSEAVTADDTPMSAEELQAKLKEAQEQIALLTNEIDTANKNMVKVKSSHKLKIKQMQKTIDNFSKGSDTNNEIIKLNEELHQLTQKVAELEEEKGNLQLHLVDYDSGRLTETDTYKKMIEMETLAETRLNSISLLEAQKFDLVQELHILQQKNVEMEDKLDDLSQMQNEQVSSEMKSVQLEEELDKLVASKKECELVIENLKLDKEQLNDTITHLQEEHRNALAKLDQYVHENIELTDKLEKLSAEKVSSAESIEIVESLTTQEKLELEEYNKGMVGHKIDDPHPEDSATRECTENIEKLVQESAELNKKIELFTQERQEVMEKMNKLSHDNEVLQQKIFELQTQSTHLQNNIQTMNNEKHELESLNEALNRQIEELKRERLEIMKEAADPQKPVVLEESLETSQEAQVEDKQAGEKGNGVKGAKNIKQLTKEILKLKNTIKERENEIADCEMKILSLEEQHQKNVEVLQANAAFEIKIKTLTEENNIIKEELNNLKQYKETENQIIQLKQNNEYLQNELSRFEQERLNAVNTRDSKIQELESMLLEYENQIKGYVNCLQEKDKELTEYFNQLTKLNEVSQKLKSTVELLEEEKAKDTSTEVIKTLNKQIAAFQKKLGEFEDRIRIMEEEKIQLLNLKSSLESKNQTLELELKDLQDLFAEKQTFIKELVVQKDKFTEEMALVAEKTKERDEEIHEIKLQLRKESIENEKLRNDLLEKEKAISVYVEELETMKDKLNTSSNQSDEVASQELKNKELMEKLKKFAANLKKKNLMYTELEALYNESQSQLEKKSYENEQLSIQIESLPSTQEKLKHAEEELNRIMTLKSQIEQQRYNEISQMQNEYKLLEEKLLFANHNLENLNHTLTSLNNDLQVTREENTALQAQVAALNNRIVELEIDQRNNTNLITKVSGLENENALKQSQINELLHKLEGQEQMLSQVQFGQDAKIQERDLYIEGLEAEITKYKSRIIRLEESISTMEDRRHSLERKADQLGSQLDEKQKAYDEYTNQEDHLVGRLAALMDHDRVLEKQLHEVESENRELRNKVHKFDEENQQLRKSFADMQEHYNLIKEKADRAQSYESEITSNQERLRYLEAELKKQTSEHQTSVSKSRRDIEELEVEFNTQIENSIKEKKMLSEKYEKVNEHVIQLEQRLQEYQTQIHHLNSNLGELTKVNQELVENKTTEKALLPDYTEQYIQEINRLNALLNNKHQEFEDLYRKHQSTHNTFESKIAELIEKQKQSTFEINNLIAENQSLLQSNEQLFNTLNQKDEQLNELIKKKTVTFEMNIPKTEGMFISSTIEPLSEAPGRVDYDVSALESQIVSEATIAEKPKNDDVKTHSSDKPDGKAVVEEVISPKKAYLCYKTDDEVQEPTEDIDPFNSDEGWGLGETTVESEEIVPGFTHFSTQIAELQKENDSLKQDILANNAKLHKALKKIKELKASNDMLTSELKISKQISQSSMLDSAIEDELQNQVQELEKQLEDLNKELVKERKEKASVIKQNEVFHSANDRLTEMKEKLDNEIELWKFKFKEANDKLETDNWDSEPKTATESAATAKNDSHLSEELVKLEKENDELSSMTDQLSLQNKNLTIENNKVKEEIIALKTALQQTHTSSETANEIEKKLLELKEENGALTIKNESLAQKIIEIESLSKENADKYKALKVENENLLQSLVTKTEDFRLIKDQYESFQGTSQVDIQKLVENCVKLEDECKLLKQNLELQTNNVADLTSDLEKARLTISFLEQNTAPKNNDVDDFSLNERYSGLEDQYRQIQASLEASNKKISELQLENTELTKQLDQYNTQVREDASKIERLNSENDKLLSTVTELQTSISSAMDQRGFEIAELWKQHLAQREAEFHSMEQELRNQLLSSESKYEQLLDKVQSSGQEETNTLVMVEQINSLQSKLQDKESHLKDLQMKYAEVLGQLDLLRSEIEDEKVILENKLLNQQEEYEKIIKESDIKNQESNQHLSQTVTELQEKLTSSEDNVKQLSFKNEELSSTIQNLETNIADLTHQMLVKDGEISQKTHDVSITLAQRNEELENLRKVLVEYEKKIEDLNYEKESELAILRLKLHETKEYYDKSHSEKDSEHTTLIEELNAKIVECTALSRQVADLNKLLEEQMAKETEMQAALESQELEIVNLKDDIESLREMLKAAKIEKRVSFAADTKPGADDGSQEESLNKELLDAVPRAELDLALYLLHQRDVRCEELTMELTQLLEERDTLQLRLSDSLRSYEELKFKCKSAGFEAALTGSLETVSEATSFSVEREQPFVDTHRVLASRSSSISTDPDADKPNLQAKLSELRGVHSSRDVRSVHDSAHQQLGTRLMRRDVANLPPEAVEQLSQAHHTLSRDSQSTPTVLLNWLRGKSTPKVVHM